MILLTEKKKRKIARDEAIIREISQAIKDGGMKSAIYIRIGKKYKISPITAGTLYRNHLKNLKS